MPRNDLAGNGFTLAVARGLHDGVALLMGMDTMRIEEIFRAEHGRILATLIRLLGDFDTAEEGLQEAFASALEQWPAAGTPASAICAEAGRDRAPSRALGRGGGRARAGGSAPPDLHLLSPGALDRRAGRAHAANAGGLVDRGDRARLSRAGADDGASTGPRQGQDPGRPH